MARLLYVVSHSTADPARAVTALATAAASTEREGAEISLWLSGEGARLAVAGVAEMLKVPGLPSASESLERLAEGGAPLYCSKPCFARLGFEASTLAEGTELADPVHLASLVDAGWTPVTL